MTIPLLPKKRNKTLCFQNLHYLLFSLEDDIPELSGEENQNTDWKVLPYLMRELSYIYQEVFSTKNETT